MKGLFFCIIILWLLPNTQAQDSIPIQGYIDTIMIQNSKLSNFGTAHHSLFLDNKDLAKYSSSSLAQVLALESSFFVKNYGVTGISTLSGRGGGASHTAVLWEGFNIQNPMLGQSDVSLLPTSFVDNIQVQYGGESALFGNGGIGGGVHLSSQDQFQKGWRFSGTTSLASFENLNQQLKLSYSNKWYAGSVRSFYKSGKNDFFFRDINAFGSPKPIRRQSNAELEQYGWLTSHAFRFGKQWISTKVWYQHSFRQIPPNLLQTTSEDRQEDAAFRAILSWKGLFRNQVWKARTAFFVETLIFKNAGINSWSRMWTSSSALEHKWYLHDWHTLHSTLNYSFVRAKSTGYANSHQQHQTGLSIAYKFQTKDKKWQLNSNLRLAMLDLQVLRPALSLGSVWNISKKLQWKTLVSYNFRYPTFNDLYWDVLGNPDLLPEYSWNSEMGFVLPLEQQKWFLEAELTGFSNLVDNWILWYPGQDGLWRPDNIQQVWAKGIEFNLKTKWKIRQCQLATRWQYTFTSSTPTQNLNKASIGKQLIYTPLHQANMAIEFRYKGFLALYQHHFTSARFINTENTEVLPFYQLGNLRLQQQLNIKKTTLTFFAQINNIFGTEYQVVSTRPMPWQQFEAGISIKL